MSNKKLLRLIEGIKGRDSYAELSEKMLERVGLRISVSSLKKYASIGNDTRFPSYETLQKMEEYAHEIGVNVPSPDAIIEELQGADNIIALRRISKSKQRMGIVDIPILGQVPAGPPLLEQENLTGYLPLPDSFVKDPSSSFLLHIRGDSMEDVGIADGDLVLVRFQQHAENGQTIIARVNGEVTCKRFYLIKDIIRLEPANSKYKALESRDIEIIGVVNRIIKQVD